MGVVTMGTTMGVFGGRSGCTGTRAPAIHELARSG